MTQPLLRELAHHEFFRQQLEEQFPDIDEETLFDTLSGLTDLDQMLAAVVRSQLDDLALATALRERMADMQHRLARLEQRADRKREIVASAMERAQIKKITEPDFTLSLRQTPRPLIVSDEAEIPEDYWKPQPPKLDRKGLIDALKQGEIVPGALLGNGGVTISVRTK